ncbi:hypothetical protein A1O3_00769 [Capronia epimyces CBS 606.96]|uniref:Transcription factor domain-containing protein n=1 Tax=Capronia epimyces CBS 606.96 TaxID=1182542 RepID=W9ZCG4_9EURO|nr:uncharacterized protein A1O3_00769 [Capronia epimyces CBS 606.96]EXJ92219.1 hypothetical protein A1O3_00769 [Capronia epimyces CBS 606.96]
MRSFEHHHPRRGSRLAGGSRKRRRVESTPGSRTEPEETTTTTTTNASDNQNNADAQGEQQQQASSSSDHTLDHTELWSDQNFFAVDPFPIDPRGPFSQALLDEFLAPDTAREAWDADLASLASEQSQSSSTVEGDLVTRILFPDLPSLLHRQVDLGLLNPFAEGSVGRYNAPRTVVAAEGEVNGYLKFRLQRTQTGFTETRKGNRVFGRTSFGTRQRPSALAQWERTIIPLLPSGFGRALKLDDKDRTLLNFYTTAYCRGRTLIPQNNAWLTEITPMAESDPIVQHSLLALSGAYVLDYVQSDDLRQRTNRHYAKACELISQALSNAESHDVGKSAALVAAVILLEADDEIIWELRRPKSEIPNFIRGLHLAKRLLDHSDPGYRYWKATNVQSTKSWAGLSMVVAVGCILPELMSPLLPTNPKDSNYSWLLWGTKKEVHTIYGCKGLSPKLIHIFAQITRLCAQLKESPDSVIVPMGAAKIQEILESFRQRSRLSEGYPTTQELLDSCELDEDGKVNSATKVTELSGECWVYTAKIYLQCRFFRKPRSHPDVRSARVMLQRCLKPLPESGPLLTAQTPFFPVVLMAIISYTPEDRDVAREWFESVLARGGRSNIPPIWQATKLLWAWLDGYSVGEESMSYDEDTPVGLRHAWWEDMVEYLMEEVGWMSLT